MNYKTRKREPYVTFISAEAADYIRTYLIMRQGRGEQMTPETPVFITERGGSRFQGRGLRTYGVSYVGRRGLTCGLFQ